MAGMEGVAEVTHDELIARARALRPVLVERLAVADELRRVPDATIADFHAAGFFRMLQPKRWGGLEVHPRTFFEVQTEIAKGCASSAWVLGVVAVHAWQLGLFAEQAQKDVWESSARTLISSSYAPTGNIERVPGGFKVSGRWSFSSGCDHCSWVFLGGFAPPPPKVRRRMRPRTCAPISCRGPTTGSTTPGTSSGSRPPGARTSWSRGPSSRSTARIA